jgi:hypothetical protein
MLRMRVTHPVAEGRDVAFCFFLSLLSTAVVSWVGGWFRAVAGRARHEVVEAKLGASFNRGKLGPPEPRRWNEDVRRQVGGGNRNTIGKGREKQSKRVVKEK